MTTLSLNQNNFDWFKFDIVLQFMKQMKEAL